MEPTEALQSAENVLRTAIHYAFPGGTWLQAAGAPDARRLEVKRANETRARDGAATSGDLLDYADTGHLAALVEQNWDRFEPIFLDESRTRTYLATLRSVRNTVAHTRPLVPFERDLLSGVAQHLGNLLAVYRTSKDGPHMHYPSIESLRDSHGRQADLMERYTFSGSRVRLEVGEVVRLEGRVVDPRGRAVRWYLTRPYAGADEGSEIGEGPDLAYDWTVTEGDVGETCDLIVSVCVDSRFHLYMNGHGAHSGVSDDDRVLQYSVSPPVDE